MARLHEVTEVLQWYPKHSAGFSSGPASRVRIQLTKLVDGTEVFVSARTRELCDVTPAIAQRDDWRIFDENDTPSDCAPFLAAIADAKNKQASGQPAPAANEPTGIAGTVENDTQSDED